MADFAPELGMIISETKYLEQLGFQVPELARNVALQVRALKELSLLIFTLYLTRLQFDANLHSQVATPLFFVERSLTSVTV